MMFWYNTTDEFYGKCNHGKFVRYDAAGVIYERDKKTGLPSFVKTLIRCNGVVKAGPEMLGKIFRQNAELLPCDWVDVDTYTI